MTRRPAGGFTVVVQDLHAAAEHLGRIAIKANTVWVPDPTIVPRTGSWPTWHADADQDWTTAHQQLLAALADAAAALAVSAAGYTSTDHTCATHFGRLTQLLAPTPIHTAIHAAIAPPAPAPAPAPLRRCPASRHPRTPGPGRPPTPCWPRSSRHGRSAPPAPSSPPPR